MKGTVVLHENDEADAEKLKLAPEKTKKDSSSFSSRSQNEYEMGNVENTVTTRDINQIKSETVSEVKTPNPFEAKDDTSSASNSIAASKQEFHGKKDSERMQSTIIDQGRDKTVEKKPMNVSKEEDSHTADLTKDDTSTLETQISSTDQELPDKGNVKAKKLLFQSKPSAHTQCPPGTSRKQGQRINSYNLTEDMEKYTVQRNSAPDMHVEPQKVESKQTQELKGNTPETDDGKNVTSVETASSAKKFENLDSASHAHTNKGPYVTKLATNDSKSDHANWKQSGSIEARVKSEPSQDKLDTPPKQQSSQKPKLSISTKPAGEKRSTT